MTVCTLLMRSVLWVVCRLHLEGWMLSETAEGRVVEGGVMQLRGEGVGGTCACLGQAHIRC